MKIYEIVEATGGKLLSGDLNRDITMFSQDSRKVEEGCMYIPIKGERFDGHKFIEGAANAGAYAFISEQAVSLEDKAVILVDDTLKALKDMATYLRKHRDVKVVGVTGSVGKTSTRDMVYSVVKQKYNTLKTEGNYNNEIGLPLTILRHKDEEVLVLEMGMNHLQEMSRLSYIACPDIACITNVGTAHIGEVGSRENILKAKLEIIDGMQKGQTLIINQDNDMLQTVKLDDMNVVRVGKDIRSTIRATELDVRENDSEFVVEYHGKKEKIYVPVQGEHMISNALIAIAVGLELDISIEDIKKGIESFVLTKNRMDIVEKENGITVIDGTYNASVDSMKSSIDVLSHYKRRKVAILADMLELGEYSQELHEEVGHYLVDKAIDVVVLVGHESKYIYDVVEGKMDAYYFNNNDELIQQLPTILQENDIVLAKGSHSMNLKQVVESIK